MGRPGPDRGEGGKYLIVPAGYDGPIPDGYFVAESPSNINWLILRGLLVDGKPDTARDNFRTGLRIYPLVPGRRAAGDGVHRHVRTRVQHHPRQQRRVLRRTRRRHRTRTGRRHRRRDPRRARLHRHQEGHTVRARRTHAGHPRPTPPPSPTAPPARSRSRPATPKRNCSPTGHGRPASSAATTAG